MRLPGGQRIVGVTLRKHLHPLALALLVQILPDNLLGFFIALVGLHGVVGVLDAVRR